MIPSAIIKEYFPKDPEHIDRQFLIDVWYNQDPFGAKKYYDLVMDSKVKKAGLPPVYKMEFPEDMLDDLLKYKATRKWNIVSWSNILPYSCKKYQEIIYPDDAKGKASEEA